MVEAMAGERGFLDELRQSLDETETAADIQTVLERLRREAGLRMAGYNLSSIPGKGAPAFCLVAETNAGLRLCNKQPDLSFALGGQSSGLLPFKWSFNPAHGKPRASYADVRERDAVIGGMTIPIRGRLQETAFFVFAPNERDEERIELKKWNLPRLHIAAHLLHSRVMALVAPETVVAPQLSSRELRCLGFIDEGMRDSQIATALGLSLDRVSAYVDSLRHKLGAADRAGVAARARALNISPHQHN